MIKIRFLTRIAMMELWRECSRKAIAANLTLARTAELTQQLMRERFGL